MNLRTHTQISIPYSSIKRELGLDTSNASMYISIPYSSIKSIVQHKIKVRVKSFQFHIVRLKASSTRTIYDFPLYFNSI